MRAQAAIRRAGYAGSFHVFGHGGCFGELGHCDIPQAHAAPTTPLPHQLTPQFKTVIITDALRAIMARSARKTFTVTIVPVIRDNPASLLGNVTTRSVSTASA